MDDLHASLRGTCAALTRDLGVATAGAGHLRNVYASGASPACPELLCTNCAGGARELCVEFPTDLEGGARRARRPGRCLPEAQKLGAPRARAASSRDASMLPTLSHTSCMVRFLAGVDACRGGRRRAEAARRPRARGDARRASLTPAEPARKARRACVGAHASLSASSPVSLSACAWDHEHMAPCAVPWARPSVRAVVPRAVAHRGRCVAEGKAENGRSGRLGGVGRLVAWGNGIWTWPYGPGPLARARAGHEPAVDRAACHANYFPARSALITSAACWLAGPNLQTFLTYSTS